MNKRSYFYRTCVYLLNIVVLSVPVSVIGAAQFDFKKQLFDPPTTLSVNVQQVNQTTGYVTINGGDSQAPTQPFTFDWGDGNIENGFFSLSHTYNDLTKNYIVKVTAHYPGQVTDEAKVVVRFVAPQITPISLPGNLAVTIPNQSVSLTSRISFLNVPSGVSYFDNSSFGIVPRSTVEYILSVAAKIEYDFVNNDVVLLNSAFHQKLLKLSSGNGLSSLWFTDPISFVSQSMQFSGFIPYSSFFHEMGHNFSLNSPSGHQYGGKIEFNANAIYSEAVANILASAVGYEILNNYQAYGISDDLALDIENTAISSMETTRGAYDDYVSGGKNFESWNDSSTSIDETFGTFTTIAYKFAEHAENSGGGYSTPAKRMMELLQVFDSDLEAMYDRHNDTVTASTFRSTLMVTALSHAFDSDLRQEFSNLNFPIDDDIYDDLLDRL